MRRGCRKGWDARLATSPNRSNLGVVRIWERSITKQNAFSAPRYLTSGAGSSSPSATFFFTR